MLKRYAVVKLTSIVYQLLQFLSNVTVLPTVFFILIVPLLSDATYKRRNKLLALLCCRSIKIFNSFSLLCINVLRFYSRKLVAILKSPLFSGPRFRSDVKAMLCCSSPPSVRSTASSENVSVSTANVKP